MNVPLPYLPSIPFGSNPKRDSAVCIFLIAGIAFLPPSLNAFIKFGVLRSNLRPSNEPLLGAAPPPSAALGLLSCPCAAFAAASAPPTPPVGSCPAPACLSTSVMPSSPTSSLSVVAFAAASAASAPPTPPVGSCPAPACLSTSVMPSSPTSSSPAAVAAVAVCAVSVAESSPCGAGGFGLSIDMSLPGCTKNC